MINRDDLFTNLTTTTKWDVPVAINRNNPLPLDASSVFESLAALETYAATSPVAYMGQICAVIAENEDAKAYIILNEQGDVQEVGSAVIVDDASIAFQDGELAIKSWGKEYYKYVAATGDSEATYELQVVDSTHPWQSGLEPRVTLKDGNLVLGWYEPNPTTVEGLNSQISSLQTSVNELVGDVAERYTATETDEKIAQAIAAAPHLKREVVDSIEEVVADNIIYMVPTGLQEDDDKYDEFMLINGVVERVGSWEVDLSAYAKKTDVEASLDEKVNKNGTDRLMTVEEGEKLATVSEGAEKNFISSASESFDVSNGLLSIVSIPQTLDLSGNNTIANLNTLLGNKVDKVDGKSLVSDTEIEKLLTVQANAEKNVIQLVTSEFAISENRELSLVSVDSTKVIDSATGKTVKSAIDELNTTLNNMSDFGERLTDLEERMVWQTLAE